MGKVGLLDTENGSTKLTSNQPKDHRLEKHAKRYHAKIDPKQAFVRVS
jgi:hypothetical protein